MESPQGSWQCENFSSAHKDITPPISPAPPSPTLYSLINYSSPSVVVPHKLGGDVLVFNQNNNTFLVGGIGTNSSEVTSPFIKDDGPTSLLSSVSNSLGGIGTISTAPANRPSNNNLIGQNINLSIPNEMNDADLAWNDEESFNLEAFEGFEDLDFAEVNNILADEVQPDESCLSHSITNNNNNLNLLSAEPKINELSVSLNDQQEKVAPQQGKNELMDQFESIMKTYESNGNTQIIDGEIVDISGIPAVLFNADELVEFQNEGIDLGTLSGDDDSIMMEDDYGSDSDGGSSSSSGSYRSSVMDGQEIYLVTDADSELNVFLEDSSAVPSRSTNFLVSFNQPSSVASSSNLDEDDDEDDRQEMTLDALLGGDVDTAAAMYSSSNVAVKRGRGFAKILNAIPAASNETRGRSAIVKAGLTVQKPERRGRKPSSVAVGKPWVHVKDKALRKKEQNKTAATRYRQKKKVEAEISMKQEQELTVQYDLLMKEKENLAKEISMVKNLLRAVFSAKKAQKKRR